jgi:hypothetical protein
MWFLDAEYPMWDAKVATLHKCAQGNTVILGDSRPVAGLIPNEMGDDVTNLALGGGTPIESFYIAEKLLKCPTPPKRVVISFASVHFMLADVYWTRSAMFHFFTFDQMEEVRDRSRQLLDGNVYQQGTVNSVVGLLKNASYSASFPSYYFPAMVNAGFIGRRERNDQVLRVVLNSRGHHLFGTAPRSDWPAYDAWQSQFTPSPLFDFYFDRTIALLSSNHINVYFVSMPINELTFKSIRQDLPIRLGQYLKGFEQRYPGFRIAGEVIPHLPTEYFGDPVHLNGPGAKLWSQLVARTLAEAGNDEGSIRAGR